MRNKSLDMFANEHVALVRVTADDGAQGSEDGLTDFDGLQAMAARAMFEAGASSASDRAAKPSSSSGAGSSSSSTAP